MDYDRDWYVVVVSFASGIVLCAVFAVLLFCYCKRCNKPSSFAAAQSQEALETQESGDFNPFYEEVPGAGNDAFEAIGRFDQPRYRTNGTVHE